MDAELCGCALLGGMRLSQYDHEAVTVGRGISNHLLYIVKVTRVFVFEFRLGFVPDLRVDDLRGHCGCVEP